MPEHVAFLGVGLPVLYTPGPQEKLATDLNGGLAGIVTAVHYYNETQRFYSVNLHIFKANGETDYRHSVRLSCMRADIGKAGTAVPLGLVQSFKCILVDPVEAPQPAVEQTQSAAPQGEPAADQGEPQAESGVGSNSGEAGAAPQPFEEPEGPAS